MKQKFYNLKSWLEKFILNKTERRHFLVGHPKHWKLKRDFQIDFLKKAGLDPQNYFLDIGCGTLRGGIPIIDYLAESHYTGIDSRQETLDAGIQELEDAKLTWKKPMLICNKDISSISLEKKFDLIWAFSVLFHMSDDILFDTLDFVSAHLLDNGIFYANVNIGERKSGNWQGFPVVWRSQIFYEEACSQRGLVFSDIGSLKSFGHITNIESQDEQRMLKILKA